MKRTKTFLQLVTLTCILAATTSCRQTKETVKREIHTIRDTVVEVRWDTIKIKEVINSRPSITNTVVIKEPCDSLGNVKPINISAGSDGASSTVTSDGNTITFTGYTAAQVDSIISTERLSFRDRERTYIENIDKLEKEVITRSRWSKATYIFLIWAILATVLLLSKFRKLIPPIL